MPGRRFGLLALHGDQRGIIAHAAVDDGNVDVDGVHMLERQSTGPSVDGLGLLGRLRWTQETGQVAKRESCS